MEGEGGWFGMGGRWSGGVLGEIKKRGTPLSRQDTTTLPPAAALLHPQPCCSCIPQLGGGDGGLEGLTPCWER